MRRFFSGSRTLTRVLIPGLLVSAGAAFAREPITLDEFFAAALKQSEVVAIHYELVQQAEERLQQAEAVVRPTVSGYASYTWAEEPPAGVPVTSATASQQPLAKVTAGQPLFRGFREFAAMRQTRALRDARDDDYRQARLLLYRDVVQNFFAVLSLERELANYDEEIKQNQEREQEIGARLRIGRSRSSELLNVQAALSVLRAQVEQLRGQLRTARETMAFLGGIDTDTPLQDDTALPATLPPLKELLAAVEARPDVKAGANRLDAATESVKVSRGARLPSLDLVGNYYLERPANLKDINWDVQLALTIPIYSGGTLRSRVREAASQRNEAEFEFRAARRAAEQEIRSLYQSTGFDLKRLAALRNAAEATRKSYEAQRNEYRLGLVTNLEVSQALTAYQQNQRALDRARYIAKTDYLTLLTAATRGLPEEGAP